MKPLTVEEDLNQAISLATAWAAGEVETWTVLAQETSHDPLSALRQLCFIVVQLAERLADHAGGNWSVNTVLQHLALDAKEGGGETPR